VVSETASIMSHLIDYDEAYERSKLGNQDVHGMHDVIPFTWASGSV
jgi:hypothetical protein